MHYNKDLEPKVKDSSCQGQLYKKAKSDDYREIYNVQ